MKKIGRDVCVLYVQKARERGKTKAGAEGKKRKGGRREAGFFLKNREIGKTQLATHRIEIPAVRLVVSEKKQVDRDEKNERENRERGQDLEAGVVEGKRKEKRERKEVQQHQYVSVTAVARSVAFFFECVLTLQGALRFVWCVCVCIMLFVASLVKQGIGEIGGKDFKWG